MNEYPTLNEYKTALSAASAKEHLSDEEFGYLVNLYRERIEDIIMAETNGYVATGYIEQIQAQFNSTQQ